ncbi:MAG: class I tRNA ligase family protein, partial [Patescibacteria group bacterium]
ILLSPFAPHIAEELWSQQGVEESITFEPWPTFDETLTKDETITLVVQVSGKPRAQLSAAADISKDDAQALALADENVKRWIEGKEIKNMIYVPGRLINIVVE